MDAIQAMRWAGSRSSYPALADSVPHRARGDKERGPFNAKEAVVQQGRLALPPTGIDEGAQPYMQRAQLAVVYHYVDIAVGVVV